MKFGLLKTKIETILTESYKKNSFKNEIKIFKKLVLENKKISKLFQIYNELNKNKGLDESTANDYINECIKIYENSINTVTDKDIAPIENWVKGMSVKNEYETIDNLFSNDITLLETKIQSRKLIKESIKKKPIEKNKELVKLPISTMVNVANKTISSFVEKLDESQKAELKNILTTPEDELKSNFNVIQKEVLNKLSSLKEGVDSETKSRIDETIQKVSSEECNVLTYVKLKNLKENL